MTIAANGLRTTRRGLGRRLWIGMAIATGLAGLALANVHLVYVAVRSQPACVDHINSPGAAPGVYRAAKSAC